MADHSLAIGRGASVLFAFFIYLTLQLSEHATAMESNCLSVTVTLWCSRGRFAD